MPRAFSRIVQEPSPNKQHLGPLASSIALNEAAGPVPNTKEPNRFQDPRTSLLQCAVAKGNPADSTNFHLFATRCFPSGTMSTLQHPSSFCHQPGDSFWDAPRLHKDKIYRDSAKPATALGSMDTRREEFPSVSPRVPLLDLRSKSGPAIPTVKSLGLRISPTASVDMSTSRFSLDVRSLSASSQHQPERPGGLAQGLRSKSSRLMRRQNSRSNSGTLVWLDDSGDRPKRSSVYDLWSRSTSGHSRIRSAGDSMFTTLVLIPFVDMIHRLRG